MRDIPCGAAHLPLSAGVPNATKPFFYIFKLTNFWELSQKKALMILGKTYRIYVKCAMSTVPFVPDTFILPENGAEKTCDIGLKMRIYRGHFSVNCGILTMLFLVLRIEGGWRQKHLTFGRESGIMAFQFNRGRFNAAPKPRTLNLKLCVYVNL